MTVPRLVQAVKYRPCHALHRSGKNERVVKVRLCEILVFEQSI